MAAELRVLTLLLLLRTRYETRVVDDCDVRPCGDALIDAGKAEFNWSWTAGGVLGKAVVPHRGIGPGKKVLDPPFVFGEKAPMKQLTYLTTIFCACVALALTAYGGPEPLPSGKEMKQVAPAPPECDYTWTGFYLGARGGYGWSVGELHSQFLFPNPTNATIEPGHQDLDFDGFIGGGELGFNWQLGHFVLGAEADFVGSDISGSNTKDKFVSDFSPPDVPLRASQDVNWLGTARGRVGFVPWCRVLIYATGGLAYADVDHSATLDYFAVGGHELYHASRSDTQFGWTAGGGLEFAITHHWSIKAEYLYLDVGDESKVAPGSPPNPPFQVHYTWDTQFHTVSAGLNFKF